MTKTMKTELTRDELSLLLYLETRAVDYAGRVNTYHMNKDDFEIIKKWDKTFVKFGRIIIADYSSDGTHWVILSRNALKIAHKERINKSERMYAKRTWHSTKEKTCKL